MTNENNTVEAKTSEGKRPSGSSSDSSTGSSNELAASSSMSVPITSIVLPWTPLEGELLVNKESGIVLHF